MADAPIAHEKNAIMKYIGTQTFIDAGLYGMQRRKEYEGQMFPFSSQALHSPEILAKELLFGSNQKHYSRSLDLNLTSNILGTATAYEPNRTSYQGTPSVPGYAKNIYAGLL
ncbi:hypothetical protein HOC13_04265 [Candidatus Woesearchaeota archaeon]|jgi:hypothetical protein|nr:hypothetical protein [Candidatus Woesearchaeota archaeon]